MPSLSFRRGTDLIGPDAATGGTPVQLGNWPFFEAIVVGFCAKTRVAPAELL